MPRSCSYGRDSRSFTSNLYRSVCVVTGSATVGDKCSGLRVESVPCWGVEAAWRGDGAVVTRWGGLSGWLRGHNWRVLCLVKV